MEELIQKLSVSTRELGKVINEGKYDINSHELFNRFRQTLDNAMKFISYFVLDEGYLCENDEDFIRQAYILGLISDDELWIDMLNTRNLIKQNVSITENSLKIIGFSNHLSIFSENARINFINGF